MSISTTYNEAELLAGIAKGEEEAFRILFQQYFRPLCFFAHSFIDDMEPAKDIAQEALYKLWNRKENFITLTNIKAFLYISAKNACIN
ncbi:MAG TPA: sigma factor, partial [Chitinophagaceae bacterium]|nr:sigma factor [Chitinophagaceae bacterium]